MLSGTSACFVGHHRRVAKHTAWPVRRDDQGMVVEQELLEVGTSPKGTDVPQGAGVQEIIEGTYGWPSAKS
jgi:hypothetical protein